jgi:hypothetical protein
VSCAPALLADVLFVGAEVAAQYRTAEFIAERGAAERAFDHDLQRRGDAVRLAVGRLRAASADRRGDVGAFSQALHGVRQHQVRHREAGQAGLRLGAAAGRALVADLAAGAGGGARERRNRGRVVVRLDLHQRVRQLGRSARTRGLRRAGRSA